jgi:hypothetical protein
MLLRRLAHASGGVGSPAGRGGGGGSADAPAADAAGEGAAPQALESLSDRALEVSDFTSPHDREGSAHFGSPRS